MALPVVSLLIFHSLSKGYIFSLYRLSGIFSPWAGTHPLH